MSFLRHWEIYQNDVIRERARLSSRALTHHPDESPVGYSLAGCSPAEPASASPTTPQSMSVYLYSANSISGTFLNEATTYISGPFFDEATGIRSLGPGARLGPQSIAAYRQS